MAKKKSGQKSKASAKKTPSEMLLVASKTKEALKKFDVNVAADAFEGLNFWVHWLCEQAAKRAAANGRKTVRSHDFLVM